MKERHSFGGSIGFVLAAAGSAVGLGNIWRFPYFAAKDGGGLFLLVYLILLFTFGFTLLITEVAIGRKTLQGPLTAYDKIKKGWKPLGVISCIVPVIIMPYYCVIGGWVLKYCFVFFGGEGTAAAEDGYFGSYITSTTQPLVLTVVFLAICATIVILGVNKGIEASSKIIMPILIVLVLIISVFALTITHTDAEGITRTGMEGLKIYLIPNREGLTFASLLNVIVDAMGQLFFSLSVAMGIMVAYGSYVSKEANLQKSVMQIQLFDTAIAFLAGVMIIPAIYAFAGTEGMSAGPGLMFVSLPKIFASMGSIGIIMGILFFVMVLFAAVTSAVSVMEAVVSSLMDQFHMSRKKAAFIEGGIALIGGIFVCLGYNKMYFEVTLPTGTTGQLLDIMDYISNNLLMPLGAILTCILIGWVAKPKTIEDEITLNGEKFGFHKMYVVMIKFVAPIMLTVLLLESAGVLRLFM